MSQFRIFVSCNECAEEVDEYLVESDASIKDVVKAMAISVITDRELSPNNVERISFDSDAFSSRYVCIIQCAEYHIAVWCQTEEPKKITPDHLDLAQTFPDDWSIESDVDSEEYDKFFNILYGDKCDDE